MMAAMAALKTVQPGPASADVDVQAWRERCFDAMNDDFNTPKLIATLFEGVKWANAAAAGQLSLAENQLDPLRRTFRECAFDIMGLDGLGLPEPGGNDAGLTSPLLDLLVKLRGDAKANKDWSTADAIRDALTALGVTIKDSKEGSTWNIEG
jgi:cysteinyl-tRNA synthetase